MKVTGICSIAALTMLLGAAPVLADPPEWAGQGQGNSKHHKGHGDDDRRYERRHDRRDDRRDDRGDEDRYQAREGRYVEERYVRGGPPPWAPAHGYRRKHRDAEYRYDDDYETRAYQESPQVVAQIGIDRGTCNHETVATVLGGVAGGVIGNKVAKTEQDKAGATIAGVVIGAIVGNTIGRTMDRHDVLCTGQTLERVPDRQTVSWRHKDGQQYQVTPLRTYNREGLFCRDYMARSVISGRAQQSTETACRNPDGSWRRL